MARPPSQQPTEVELQILNLLWEQGSATARDIHNGLAKDKETNYSTTVKMLAVMHEKGLVSRDEGTRPIRFSATYTQEKTQRQVLGDLIKKLYDGSAKSLVLQALSSQRASKSDLAEIRRLLDDLDRKP